MTAQNKETYQRKDVTRRALLVKALGTVMTSPYCRCVDTAQLAFGRGIKSNNLRFTISENENETKRLSQALQTFLSTIPAKGSNSVIVAHTGNLKEAANIWPKPEGVLYFNQWGRMDLNTSGRITPDHMETIEID